MTNTIPKFRELMLLYTAPLDWNTDPVRRAEHLRAYLAHLLDPRRRGYAAVRPATRPNGDTAPDWVVGREALAAVESVYDTVWRPRAEVLLRYGRDAQEDTFHAYLEQKLQLFLDGERLLACAEDLAFGDGEAPSAVTRDLTRSAYLGLTVDWAMADILLWVPQLRIGNFWPRSARLAPPSPSDARTPSPVSGREAADQLRDYWYDVETVFRQVRDRFDLRMTPSRIKQLLVRPPLFYCAAPIPMGVSPEEILEPARLPLLETFARTLIGTQDLLSSDASGAFLEGNLLTFRCERSGDGEWQSRHLVFPWVPQEGDWEEVENEVCFVADKLAYVDFNASQQIESIISQVVVGREKMNRWGGTLDTALALARGLQRAAAFQRPGSRRRHETFRLVGQLRAAISTLDAELSPVLDDIAISEVQWRASVEATTQFAKDAFTARHLPRITGLLESSGLYRLFGEQVHRAVRRAGQIREHVQSTTAALKDILELERQEQRERDERNQKVLSYGVAALAAVTAFPILTGQLDWNDLIRDLRRWPWFARSLGELIEKWHPHLVLVATISALVTISLLLLALGRSLVPAGLHKGEFTSHLRKLREAARQAEVFDDFKTIHGREAPETAEILQLRQRLDARDKRASELLAEVIEWLLAREQPQRSAMEVGGMLSRLRALPERRWGAELQLLRWGVHQFVVSLELVERRPTPLLLPVAMSLLRFQGPKFESLGVVSGEEFRFVLFSYGFDLAWIEALEDEHRERLKALSPRECVEELRRMGISMTSSRSGNTAV